MEDYEESPIKVKHLIEYLSQFDPELSVELDRDGWLQDELSWGKETELIEKRGVFFHFKNKKGDDWESSCLYINN